MKSRLLFLTVVLQIFAVLSCNSQQKSKQELLIGEWEVVPSSNNPASDNKKEVMLFHANKVFAHGYRVNGVLKTDANGTYNLKENDTILELLPPEGTGDETQIIELTNKTLILKAKAGKESKITLKKIK